MKLSPFFINGRHRGIIIMHIIIQFFLSFSFFVIQILTILQKKIENYYRTNCYF